MTERNITISRTSRLNSKSLGLQFNFSSYASNWRLRSANVSNANNVANVNSTGYVNNNNSTNANGLAPDCSYSISRLHFIEELSKITRLSLTSESREMEYKIKNRGTIELDMGRNHSAVPMTADLKRSAHDCASTSIHARQPSYTMTRYKIEDGGCSIAELQWS